MVTTRRRQQQEEEVKRKREETLNTICNSIRKRGKTLSSTLTNDIICDILSRVPDVEDLLRFKIALYCDISSPFKLNSAVKIICPFRIHSIYDSCNGIFLVRVSCKFNRLCLWNPSTGEHKDLSDELPKVPKRLNILYCLGYDLSRDDYKVIMAYNHEGTIRDVYVYSMRTNSYKRFQNVAYVIFGVVEYQNISSGGGGGILLNGAIHWLGNHVSNKNRFFLRIVSFDLSNDEFKDLQLPDITLHTKWKRLGEFEECLCIYHVNKDSYIDVFITKEYGVKESWTKIFSINDLPFHRMWNFEAICTNNEKLLVQWNNKDLALYDLRVCLIGRGKNSHIKHYPRNSQMPV
ncbi:hypothetical protein AQUCO_01600243v1 [Aquilegia coerulea]|uniref:F-box associated beta-propeller type 1 domain-containing protein n=1 Tax=Aquilegia coerulea TaxID=218851 RepID=A0A2G5DQR2_AQUCA|nr:hypothetical protein AQUCO_01600243v1 [Aquilegia coerulea]